MNSSLTGMAAAHLRVARSTNNLDAVVAFYKDGLGFKILSDFKDHAGFDGVMLGFARGAYHLEFTHRASEKPERAPASENLLVFYLPDKHEWTRAVERLKSAGFNSIQATNPYWNKNGATFEDPDGYPIVIQNAAWPV